MWQTDWTIHRAAWSQLKRFHCTGIQLKPLLLTWRLSAMTSKNVRGYQNSSSSSSHQATSHYYSGSQGFRRDCLDKRQMQVFYQTKFYYHHCSRHTAIRNQYLEFGLILKYDETTNSKRLPEIYASKFVYLAQIVPKIRSVKPAEWFLGVNQSCLSMLSTFTR